MKKQVKTIQKVERYFTDNSSCSLEGIFSAYYKSIIEEVISENVDKASSKKEVA
ncbi:MAG: hypothetical protein N4A57_05410 [Anaeromicrobium sp.]|jgi:hypothetical protein|uniref:hypothetical protein n=1 Tax=Anaeromicrobium sp. TaxID=1929132 RepID=UPI0025EA3A02|nr:hypothetical protein [Anaeromicrobium sp.]MCT4593690.1 hypothetical protein [Anaeromicrobium sp.]